MLKQRLITATILLILVSSIIYLAPPVVFNIVATLILLAAAWEWAGLLKPGRPSLSTKISLLALVLATYISCLWLPISSALLAGVVMVVWGSAAVIAFNRGSKPMGLQLPALKLVACALLLSSTWVSLLVLRADPHGSGLVFYALTLVIVNDSAAYFGGRWIGKYKLAPLVSPKKTWEGCFCGFLASLLWSALITQLCWPTAFSVLSMVLVAIPTLIAAIMGDLFISVLKRQINLKDTGSILPGHGGLLDRIDAILMALPVFAFCMTSLGLI